MRYIMLFQYTEQGIEHVKKSPERIDALRETFRAMGAEIIDFYALLGKYDTIFVVEAPNDETAARLALFVGSQGNVRSETMRAFGMGEFREITAGMP
ncbi:MAG: GYD domain-containing protein [Armatimonadota bacterium]